MKALRRQAQPDEPVLHLRRTQAGDAVGEEMRTRDELRQAEAELAEARDALVKANQALRRRPPGRPRTAPPE